MNKVEKRHAVKASNKKSILMIVPNPTMHKGFPVGFYAEELTTPFFEFIKAGHEVKLASPKGGKVAYDFLSNPDSDQTLASDDLITIGFNHHKKYGLLMEDTPSIDALSIDEYDAIFVAGGGSPLVTFKSDQELHKFIADFYEKDKFVAMVCHASCLLLWTKLSSGELLANGKTWTGFSDDEEKFANEAVGTTVFDETIESEARKISNTTFETAGAFEAFAIRDGRLITGQQEKSSFFAAQLLIEALTEN